MKIYRVSEGYLLEENGNFYEGDKTSWDGLISHPDLGGHLRGIVESGTPMRASTFAEIESTLLPPIRSQEVWASGVTYYRSRNARMEESKSAGGGDFYDRVYSADRPELFFKATAHRVVGHRGKVAIRPDASWSVPEPELTLLLNPLGKILGYTVGNDMSSRDIEGENPLYLPQAKVYDRSCALGPGILIQSDPLPSTTPISLQILRQGNEGFFGSTTLAELKRPLSSLVDYLYRSNSFPFGCFLLTGTGIVPPDAFTLHPGDEIRIRIGGVGELVNFVG